MPRPSDHDALRLALPAMGTRFELVIAGADAPRERWRAIGESALVLVHGWHDRLSRFDRASWVSWLACVPAGTAVRLDADLLDLLALCEGVRRDSGGAFDIAGGRGGALALDAAGPSLTVIEPGVRLDFGAVAKGFALDRVRDLLLSEGVTSAIVHGGTSTVVAIGTQPTGEAWRVALGESPEAPVVALEGAALSVSRNDAAAPRPGHITDPRTGGAVAGGTVAAVIAASAALTDAWSTALLVLGERPGGIDGSITSLLPGRGGRGWRVQGPHASGVTFTRAVVSCP